MSITFRVLRRFLEYVKELKGLVIDYVDGGGGYKMGKSWVQNCLHPSLKTVKPFASPP